MLFPDSSKAVERQAEAVLATMTIWGEARGESLMGRRAVGWIIRNRCAAAVKWLSIRKKRKRHPLFGDGSVASCVLTPYQFSCWNEGDPNRDKLMQILHSGGHSIPVAEWADCWAAWTDPGPDPTLGATHYCTTKLWGDDKEANRFAWYSSRNIERGVTVERARVDGHVFGVSA